jgi:putative Mg2+ transporter-C (MgtC) family protein
VNHFEFVVNMALAVACGAAIGAERQWRQRMACLRTNALVAAGACLFVSLGGLIEEQGRMAAQIVSGIGFLGGGVILRDGLNVRGLNTAATLWCTAAVGTLAGCGYPLEAVVGTAVITFANVVLRPFARKLNQTPLLENADGDREIGVTAVRSPYVS